MRRTGTLNFALAGLVLCVVACVHHGHTYVVDSNPRIDPLHATITIYPSGDPTSPLKVPIRVLDADTYLFSIREDISKDRCDDVVASQVLVALDARQRYYCVCASRMPDSFTIEQNCIQETSDFERTVETLKWAQGENQFWKMAKFSHQLYFNLGYELLDTEYAGRQTCSSPEVMGELKVPISGRRQPNAESEAQMCLREKP